MFPITCSSIGDIISVAELILKIAKALKESSGAAQDCREFADSLKRLALVMEGAKEFAEDEALNVTLRDTLLDTVRRCTSDLECASELTSGFETLLRAPSGNGFWGRLSRGVTKLRWHFMKKSEAADFTQRFEKWCTSIHLGITLLHGDAAQSRAREQRAREEASNLRICGDIAMASERSMVHLHELERQHRAMDDATHRRVSLVAAGLHDVKQAVKRQGQAIMEDISTRNSSIASNSQDAVRERLVVFPVCALAIVFVMVDPALVSPTDSLQRSMPWFALCAVVAHILLQAASIPPTIGYAIANSIIFVDFVGETMQLPPQFCGTMEAFCDHVEVMFRRKDRKGWSFIRAQEYEIIEASSLSALTPSSWTSLVKVGVKIQLGVVLRQRGSEVTCPYCNMKVFARPASESRDSQLCEGCRRYFEASTVESYSLEPGLPQPDSEGEHSLHTGTAETGNDGQQERGVSAAGHSQKEPGERIEDFDCVHILYLAAGYNNSQVSAVPEFDSANAPQVEPPIVPQPSTDGVSDSERLSTNDDETAQTATPLRTRTPPPARNEIGGAIHLNIYLQFHGRFAALSWIDAVSGSQHAPTWTCTCRIDGLAISTGTGTHKHLARNEAADKAFEILRQK